MGCLDSTRRWQVDKELLSISIEKLGYRKKAFNDLVKSFHRWFPYISLTKSELLDSLLLFKIHYHHEFYKFLYMTSDEFYLLMKHSNAEKYYTNKKFVHGCYSVKKLSCLAILLGKGEIENKARCLFLIYNIDGAMFLREWELHMMIDHILEILLLFLPKLSRILYPNIERSPDCLEDELPLMIKRYSLYFKEIMMPNSFEIFGIDLIVRKFTDPDIGLLLKYREFYAFVGSDINEMKAFKSLSDNAEELI